MTSPVAEEAGEAVGRDHPTMRRFIAGGNLIDPSKVEAAVRHRNSISLAVGSLVLGFARAS